MVPTEAWKQERYSEPWNQGETLSIAIGQSFLLTTTIQLANLYAAIANGGTLFRPYFVKGIENSDGKLIQEFNPEVLKKTGISEKTSRLVREGLWRVVNGPHGTAGRIKIQGADLAGKTGTVQVMRISSENIYKKCMNLPYRNRHHGIFVGFAPAKDPIIVTAIIAEHACSGSGGAAPIAREVIKAYIQKMRPDLLKDLEKQIVVKPIDPPASESNTE